ncbi:MAG: energy-coupling factor transporter ATPase [Erysipelotrichaceae bacterium]|nr:energy-coupling factor transporter ATPase [Erysipelotrichaceae bacterium]
MPIRFENVSYVYSKKTPMEKLALSEINLEIKEGSFTAIVGRTGCGKSTLIQHLNALLNPTSGAVYIDDFTNAADKKKRDKKTKPLRKNVGLVFQFSEYQLFEETVEKDVAFGPKNFGDDKDTALQKAHEALREVGLDESFYERSPFELSGGEKRRVAIAGILAVRPKYLVVDEPTAGLDPSGAREMMDLFEKVHQQGTTLILVTHDMDIVLNYCSDVIVLNDGKVAKVCKPADLFDEDVSRFSLHSPAIYEFAARLEKHGFSFDKASLRDIDSLAKQIAEGCRR